MEFFRYVLLFFHILGVAAIVGVWFANFRKPSVSPWQFHGAWVQLVTGLLLVGIIEMGDLGQVNNIKIAVKLIIALIVFIAAFIGYRKQKKGEPVSTGLAHAVGGMALINVAVATLWH
ncbi:hypothetical protein LVY72_20140 [Arthrobacter sp. I2-34]|uniref:Integral membrane protein n=1 Tax=Arthrobacter hankyongi TaxID=2904801 RepID=A0ABS9LBZ6_9MICC|nr:hypothetical protein [Arthrobacter hankyongi]MCG2624203.1 hypothetical protein [Arthrobacter hankyongi]